MYTKGTGEVLDYSINYAPALGADTISASVWAYPSGITAVSYSVDGGTATTIWVSAGIAGKTYRLYNHVATSGNRILKDYIEIGIG